jgi:polyisoprenoid-binding protein YceI
MIWKIDPTHSAVEFSVKHMMFTTVRGRFKDVDGSIDIDEKGHATVTAKIDAASIDTGTPDRDAHLRSADFLDAGNYPSLVFTSKRIEGPAANAGDSFKLVGDLTIRGVTKEVALDATLEGMGIDPWGGQRAGVRARTNIDRRDWGLQWNQALETGGILVGNEVRIDLELQAVKSAAAAA